jgi:hypothetical protein
MRVDTFAPQPIVEPPSRNAGGAIPTDLSARFVDVLPASQFPLEGLAWRGAGPADRALQVLGLSGLAAAERTALLETLGAPVGAALTRMGPLGLGRAILAGAPQAFAANLAETALGEFGPRQHRTMGRFLQRYLAGYDPVVAGRAGLAAYTSAYTGSVGRFGEALLQHLRRTPAAAIGREAAGLFDNAALTQFGRGLAGQVRKEAVSWLGEHATGALKSFANDTLGKQLLASLDSKQLRAIGAELSAIPGLNGTDAGVKILKGIASGDIKSVARDLAGQVGKGLLEKYGPKLLEKAGLGAIAKNGLEDALGELGKKGLDKIATGLFGKAAPQVLAKLGTVGKVAGKVMSVMQNGKLTVADAMKVAISCIPGWGQAFAAISSLPVVGPIIDKVLGGVAGVIKKIPVVGPLVKGVVGTVGKFVGGVGKAVKGVVKGIGSFFKKLF